MNVSKLPSVRVFGDTARVGGGFWTLTSTRRPAPPAGRVRERPSLVLVPTSDRSTAPASPTDAAAQTADGHA